jgi:adenylosuccinate synthase
MKTDVLDEFNEISVCTDYKDGNETLAAYPFNLVSESIEPFYQKLAGWNTPLTDKTLFGELPSELKEYIRFIEEGAGLPVDIVSVGPDRTQTIRRNPL